MQPSKPFNRSSAALLGVLAILATACGSSRTTTPTQQPEIQSLTINANVASMIIPGQTTQASVIATMSSGASQDVTTTCTIWQTDNAPVLTVSTSGLLTAHEDGSATITATCQGVAARAALKVTLIRGQPAGPATFSLSGTVTDGSSGGMLPNVLVEILDGANAGKTARTDAAGHYAIGGLSRGTFTVAAASASYQTATKTVTVTVVADIRLDVVLSRGASKRFSLYGTVRDPIYGGIPYGVVSVASGPDPFRTFGRADLNGNYRLDDVPGGVLTLQIDGYGHDTIERTIDLETDTRLDLFLAPTTKCAWVYAGLALDEPFPSRAWDVPASGGTRQVFVWTNHPGCSWSASVSSYPWLTVDKPVGDQTATFTVTITPNTTGASRSGAVTLLPCPSNGSGTGLCIGDRSFGVLQTP